MEHASSTELRVKISEPVIVAPCTPSPKAILQLSSIDNIPGLRNVINTVMLVYNASSYKISADPAKIIREALSKVLVYYFPFAGRFRSKENGELELECTDEGALFVEAMADNDLSVLGDLDDLKPSFQQLLFWHPPHTPLEALHLLVLQVTRFTCGGFVVGVSLHHGICDARGGAKFLKGLAEMARGYNEPIVEPIWNRELLKQENSERLQFYHMEQNIESIQTLLPPKIEEESDLAFLVISYETIKHMKEIITKECKQFIGAFEVAAALAWRARTKALKIPHTENVKLVFAMDMSKSFNPPLPKGYYGNSIGIACAIDNAHDLLNGSLVRAAMIIQKSMVSLKDENFRSRMIKKSSLNVKRENMLILSDLRHVGFSEVDFGWGDPVNVCPMQQIENGFVLQNYFLFIRTAKNKANGIKLQICMPPSTMKSFQIEIEAIIKEHTVRYLSKL